MHVGAAMPLMAVTVWFVQVVAVFAPVAAAAPTMVVPFEPQTCVWFVVLKPMKSSAVGAPPAAAGIFRPAVTLAALRSRMALAPPVSVWEEIVKSALEVSVLFAPAAYTNPPLVKFDEAVATLAASIAESVKVQVVLAVVQLTKSPVVGAVANPAIVFVVVAPLDQMV